jgi:hypothetical protein
MQIRRRVALELDVDPETDQLEPEAWDLDDLLVAMAAGLARPLRTIHGMVLDTEQDRLSVTLEAFSDGIDELAEGYWIATASPRVPRAAALRGPRPSLNLLVELETLAEHARRVAAALRSEGL